MRVLLAIFLMALSLNAADIWTTKGEYTHGESVTVGVSGVTGANNNWIGVFKRGEAATWDNVIDAKWFDFTSGELVFNNLADGFYVVKVFYNDTLNAEATSSVFDIGQEQGGNEYDNGYQEGRNDACNGLEWYVDGPYNNFDTYVVGYDAGWDSCGNGGGGGGVATISTNKASYRAGEGITVSLGNVQGQNNNWVGIFPAGVDSDWGTVLLEEWFDFTTGNIDFTNNLPAGTYEARLFYNDSLNSVVVANFRVEGGNLGPTIYEDAENGNIAGWSTLDGPHTVQNVYFAGTRAIYGAGYWLNGGAYNAGFYQLLLDNGNTWNNTSQRVLELDFNAGNDTSACFQVGVEARTSQGFRMIMFSAWYGRHHYNAARTVYDDNLVILTYPLDDAMGYLHANYWKHFKVNLQTYLEQLEPGNRILSVESFILNGTSYQGRYKGYVDNIKLSSQ